MDQRQIETFLQVARTMNMTKAAETMFITQSTVSHRIKTLEEELGTVLIERKKGSPQVRLSDAGENFIPIAEDWMRVYQRAQEFCAERTSMNLRIIAPDSVHYIFKEKYRRIKENQRVRLSLVTANSDRIPAMVKDGQADIGFSFLAAKDKALSCNVVRRFPIVIFVRVSPSSRGAYSLSDLEPKKMVLLIGVGQENPQTQAFLQDHFNYPLYPSVQYDSLSSIVNNAAEGEWGVIPDIDTDRARQNENIQIISIDGDSSRFELYELERKDLSPKTKNLIETLL